MGVVVLKVVRGVRCAFVARAWSATRWDQDAAVSSESVRLGTRRRATDARRRRTAAPRGGGDDEVGDGVVFGVIVASVSVSVSVSVDAVDGGARGGVDA